MSRAFLFVAIAALSLAAAQAQAQTALPRGQTAERSAPAVRNASSPYRAGRPRTRLLVYPQFVPGGDGVYPRYYPGPNAVRDCSATYVQEFRPSGTVIVPRVTCHWRSG